MSIQKSSILIGDVMMQLHSFPVVGPKTYLKDALEEMSRLGIGIACVVGTEGKLLGILTDGDIRRMLLRVQKPFSAFFADDVIDHVTTSTLNVSSKDSLLIGVQLMDQKRVWDLPVVDENGRLQGLLHLHPAVEALLSAVN